MPPPTSQATPAAGLAPAFVVPTPLVRLSTDEELRAYRRSLFELARLKQNHFFPNDSEPHAAIVYEVLLRTATENVRIFCSCLKASVFGSPTVVSALEDALKRNVSVCVVSELSPDDSPFLSVLKSANAGLVSVWTFGRNVKDFNFAVADNRAFRFEDDSQVPRASGNMNLPDVAGKLSDYFDKVLLVADGITPLTRVA